MGLGCSDVVNKLCTVGLLCKVDGGHNERSFGDEAPGTPPCSIDPGPRSRAAVQRVQSTADVSATHVSSAASASALSSHGPTLTRKHN